MTDDARVVAAREVEAQKRKVLFDYMDWFDVRFRRPYGWQTGTQAWRTMPSGMSQ